jgi:hypothetical protein
LEYKVNEDFEEGIDSETVVSTSEDERVVGEDFENKKNRQGKQVLEVRRAIEDYLDQARLRKELDYLFDDKDEE